MKYVKTFPLSKIQDVFSSAFYNNILICGLRGYPVIHISPVQEIASPRVNMDISLRKHQEYSSF